MLVSRSETRPSATAPLEWRETGWRETDKRLSERQCGETARTSCAAIAFESCANTFRPFLFHVFHWHVAVEFLPWKGSVQKQELDMLRPVISTRFRCVPQESAHLAA